MKAFICTRLEARVTLASCIGRHRRARLSRADRGESGSYVTDYRRCAECPIGAEHARTGKLRHGLKLVELQPAASVDLKKDRRPLCVECGEPFTPSWRERVCSKACRVAGAAGMVRLADFL